jgi:hypothetical protein
MRLSENGAVSSVRLTPTACAADLLGPGDRWHLDEVFLKINGRLHYLWRAVDQDGDGLDIMVQSHRDKEGSQEILSQAIERVEVCSARDRHRQAEELQRGEGRNDAGCRTRPAQV